jgi:glycosyltransferase involved in cell wall biosynthesis
MFAPEGAPSRYAETRIVGLPSFSFPLYPDLRLVPPLFNVDQELVEFNPDLVLLINPAFLGLVGLRKGRDLEIPVVASYHTDLPYYTEAYGVGLFTEPVWRYFRWLHNQADLTLAPSNFTKTQIEEHGFERVEIWRHGVDTDVFSPRFRTFEWRERLTDGRSDASLLLYVGRLATEKRVGWLRTVLEQVPGTCLALVGDGPLREELEERFAGTPTVFAGYLKGEDLSAAYASADIFAFPSASETFGNVVLEAMASGVPVVAAASGGPVDLVQDGINGFLFQADSVADMVARIARLVRDKSYLRRLSASARSHALQQSWHAVNDEMFEHLRRLIDSSTQPDGRKALRRSEGLFDLQNHVWRQ